MSSATSTISSETVKQIISSLSSENAQQVNEIAQINAELAGKCQQQRTQFAQLIRDLTRRVEDAKQEAARVEPACVHSSRMAQLHSEKEAVKRNIRATSSGRDEVIRKLEESKDEEAQLRLVVFAIFFGHFLFFVFGHGLFLPFFWRTHRGTKNNSCNLQGSDFSASPKAIPRIEAA